MVRNLILFIMLLAAPAAFGQFLTYQDIKDLLAAAPDREEAVQFLKDHNFKEVESTDEEDGKYTLYYKQFIADEECYINLIANTDLDVYTVGEFSWFEPRWDYFQKIITDEGYELTEKRKDKGAQIYDYEGDDYDVSMSRKPDKDDKVLIKFIMSEY